MATVRRRMPYKGLKRKLERDERRELQKTEGKWFHFAIFNVGLQVSPAGATAVERELPKPFPDPLTIYGMDALMSFQFSGTNQPGAVIAGATGAYKLKTGMIAGDVPNPFDMKLGSADLSNSWAWRWWMPWVVNCENDAQERSFMVQPLKFWASKDRIRLLSGENFLLAFGGRSSAGSAVFVRISIFGRYRYLRAT